MSKRKIGQVLKDFLRKIVFGSFVLFFMSFSISPALGAEAEVTAPAPQATVAVGAQGNVGAAGPVGVQGPVGAQGQVGSTLNTPQTPAATPEASVSPATPSAEPTPTATVSESPAAASVTTENPESGGNGNNSTIDIQNNADVSNNVGANLNTGNNQVGANTAVGNITTGNIDGAVNLLNVTNADFAPGSSVGSQLINAATISQLLLIPLTERIYLDNSETGPDSTNLNSVTNPNVVTVFNQNDANINNAIEIAANTGRNDLSQNTLAGNLTTGNVNLGVNLINLANLLMPNTILTADIWNVLGNLNGNIVLAELANHLTGPNSTNENLLAASNELGVTVDQNADLSNIFDINTNTGNNTVGNNTATGDIQTGGSTVKTALTNIANALASPVLYLINVFGHWNGNLGGLDPSRVIVNEINDTTGPGSTNQNNTSLNNDANLTIDNNAVLRNLIRVNANTGDNNISDNTVVGNVRTGAVSITANVVNVMNSLSEEVGRFALRIINIFGNWNGNPTTEPTKSGESKGKTTTHHSHKTKTKVTNKTENITAVTAENEEILPPEGTSFTSQLALGRLAPETQAEIGQIAGLNGQNLAGSGGLDPRGNVFPWKLILIIFGSVFFLGWIMIELLVLRQSKISVK